MLGGRVAVYPDGRVLVISGDRTIGVEAALPAESGAGFQRRG
ncbi:MAG: hypothetical protein QXU91_05015 [Thermofilum sp.]